MSLTSWKKEFYPVEADQVAPEDALKHSFYKWRGIQEVNMFRHRLVNDGHIIRDIPLSPEHFTIDGDSCSLCQVYYDDDAIELECTNCPLFKIHNRTCGLVYSYYRYHNDPVPMIKFLEKALNFDDSVEVNNS